MAQELGQKRKRSLSVYAGTRDEKRHCATAEHSSESDGAEESDVEEDGNGEGVEEWDGVDPEAITETKRRGRQDGEGVDKPPTRDELRAIKEASELFKSNAFKLQIDALLPNVRPKLSRIKPLDEFLRILYTTLMALSSVPPSHPLEAAQSLLKHGIIVPYAAPAPNEDTAWKVAFAKPSDIAIVGSWANKVGVKSSSSVAWTVDVAIEMPVALFQEKDYLDCRFFHKKAFYLASLAFAISFSKQLHVDAFYESPSSNKRLTSLVLMPREDGSATDFSGLHARVRLLPVLPSPSPISLHHLSPSHCNLRVKLGEGTSEASSRATPIYNSDLLACTTARAHLLHTHELVCEVSSFRDALALLRVWANQRGYSPGPEDRGCVVGFEQRGYFWTALLRALLVGEDTFGQKVSKPNSRRIAGRGLSSYQLFRAALDFLAKHDFGSEAIFVKGGSKFPPEAYKKHHDAVFVDSVSVNLLTGIPLTSLDLLRQDAKITLDLLNNSSVGAVVDPFDEIFLRDRRQLSTRFDIVLGINLRNVELCKSRLLETLDFGSPYQYVLHTLATILRRALGDRVHAVAVFCPTSDAQPLSQGNTSTAFTKVEVGLILNSKNAFRLVDHGPAVSEQNSEEATEFRNFWGSKAELRRFKDGRIAESVVWEVNNSDERTQVPSSIVRFILARHLGLDADRDIRTFQKSFDDFLRVPDSLSQRRVPPGIQPGFKNAMAAFDKLVRDLKDLDEEIPLAILNVSPSSSDLRYTSVFAPIPLPSKSSASLPSAMHYLPSMEIVLHFERSSRWPDDLAAIQKMKLAFFERIARALMTKVTGLKASVVTGDGWTSSSILNRAYLEIVTPDGWAFCARIWHDREATHFDRLLGKKQSSVTNGAASNAKKTERSERLFVFEAYRFYSQRYIHAPKHHRAIASLCHRFPAYAGSVRLVKRWLASHWLFEGHVSPEAVELLCAFIFVGDGNNALRHKEEGQAGTPATKELGFFRVISLLKDWAWESGLFVPVYETDPTSEEDGAVVSVKAGSGRGAWTISTSEDREGRAWTSEGPDAVVARRIRALARSCMAHVLSHERVDLDPKALFLHPINDYDILIHLRPDVLCRMHQSVGASDAVLNGGKKYANISLSSAEDDKLMRVDFDPAVMFFNDLKRVFAGTLEFFFDPFGGSIIGAVWDPSLLAARPFRVLADYSSMPSITDEKGKRKEQVVLNRGSVLAEIQRLGEGLVKAIEVQHVYS